MKDLFFVTGHADVKSDNSTANSQNDPVGQVRFILEQMKKTFSQAGYTKHNIVRIN